jgi:hypothetical protein
MTSSLSDLLLDRLEKEAKPQDGWPELVLAALEGAAAVEQGAEAGRQALSPSRAQRSSARILAFGYVEGFRGIGVKREHRW